MAYVGKPGPGGLFEGLGRVKPMDLILRQGDEKNGLRRSLGTLSLAALGIGAIIGAGIFVLTGIAAATYAGPGLVLSYVVAGIVSGLAALCYAEFASSVPVAGSAYTYSYATLGEFIAWIIGWDLILEYAVGAATVSISWSGYLGDFLKSTFGLALPKALTVSRFAANGGGINLPAALIVLLITGLLILGTNETKVVNNIIVAVKLAIIVFFLVVGFGHIKPANWRPFLPFGVGGVFGGASIIFFAYIGFDQISTSAEETRDPGKSLPRAIFLSLSVCTVPYILVSGTLTGILKYTRLNNASPVSHAMLELGLNWASTIISIGAIAGLTTVLLVLLYGQSRVFFSMARDGLIPGLFSHVHPRFRTPYLSSAIIGVIVALGGALVPEDVAAKLVNIGTLAAFVLVSGGILVLRHTQPDLPRAYRVPFVPVVPILSMLASLFLIITLPTDTKIRFVVWLVIGLFVYFLYSKRHSRLQTGEDDVPAYRQ